MYKFKPYGPFTVPIEDGRVAVAELNSFWKEIKTTHPGYRTQSVVIYSRHVLAARHDLGMSVKRREQAFRRRHFSPQSANVTKML
jgi:hypothetical protein